MAFDVFYSLYTGHLPQRMVSENATFCICVCCFTATYQALVGFEPDENPMCESCEVGYLSTLHTGKALAGQLPLGVRAFTMKTRLKERGNVCTHRVQGCMSTGL